MRRLALVPLIALGIAACENSIAPVPAASIPAFAISDGVHSAGNTHFYFLSPMVNDPAVSGIFDPNVDAAVEICSWTGVTCGSLLATFTRTTGPGGALVTVDPAKEAYAVDWRTRDFPVDPGQIYRIRVLQGKDELGFADVQVVVNNREARNVNTDEFIPLVDGHVLRIRFRIERPLPLAYFSGGFRHTCGINTSGAVYCWGSNESGQLGNGTTTSASTPVPVGGGLTFVALTLGAGHTCALTASDAAYCWGFNARGQLGNGTVSEEPITTPTLVSGGLVFRMLQAGNQHTCGLTPSGAAYCWGDGLGRGVTTGVVTTPTAVDGRTTFSALSSHLGDYTCGLDTSGKAYCWGYSLIGTKAKPGALTATPTAVTGGISFVTLAAGPSHTCGLIASGEAFCWGQNDGGQLGDGTQTDASTPTAVPGALTFTSIVAGHSHTCGLTTSGVTYCWGRGDFGALGVGPNAGSLTPPTPVIGGLTFVNLTAAYDHNCALVATGLAYCWGSNSSRELGDGTTTNAFSPTAVTGGLVFRTP